MFSLIIPRKFWLNIVEQLMTAFTLIPWSRYYVRFDGKETRKKEYRQIKWSRKYPLMSDIFSYVKNWFIFLWKATEILVFFTPTEIIAENASKLFIFMEKFEGES